MTKRIGIDADLIVYESCHGAQARAKNIAIENNEEWDDFPAPFEFVANKAEATITEIVNNIQLHFPDEVLEVYLAFSDEHNFRREISVENIYKEGRTKPYHYKNIRIHLMGMYYCETRYGLEADDLLSINQRQDPNHIIASRDKDLRIIPGWYYGWENNNQPEYGPKLHTELGYLDLTPKRKLKGAGLKFFYAQLILGDSVDNIGGIPRKGDVYAYNLLHECENEEQLAEKIAELYQDTYGDEAKTLMLERGRLLWMTSKLEDDGITPVLWEIPESVGGFNSQAKEN